MRIIKKKFSLAVGYILNMFFWIIGKVTKRNDIILVSERGYEARDNAYYFFKYMTENHPEYNVCFVIDYNSPDYLKVANIGKTIKYKSFKHYYLYYSASMIISTHVGGGCPDWEFFYRWGRNLTIPAKTVFLQHGILVNEMPSLYSESTKLDIFISGAKKEYEFIIEKLHYPSTKVKYTGLARYDALHDFVAKRQILIMPTWRSYLGNKDKTDILKSNYYCEWQRLLMNDLLKKMLEESEIELYFYPHYEMQKYIKLFATCSDRIHIADIKKYDVQTLLKESALLITDYSSVFFDFAYMKKPVIYFQFDKDEFYRKHYQKGYFLYERDGFGPVFGESKSVLEYVKKMIDEKFVMEDKYRQKQSLFFELHDNKNSERIFEAIKEML